MYLPLQVGAEGKLDENGQPLDFGYVRDDTGDHISGLNAGFSELTGWYWAWKNLDADYLGLVHYRRYFRGARRRDPWDSVLTYDDLAPDLGHVKVFVPKKRRYYIETLYSHYAHTHYAQQIDETRAILEELYPAYLRSFDRVVRRRSGYMFNMMILDREIADSYSRWLFNILFTLRERIQMPELSAFQSRFYGRISEIAFNVWLDYQVRTGKIRKDEIKELPYVYMEKVDWFRKGVAFLSAKYFNKKYDNSF